MQQACPLFQRPDGIRDGREGPVFDVDQFHRVFGDVTVGGGDDCNRLAHVPDLVDGDREKLDGYANGTRDRINRPCDISAGHYPMHAGKRLGPRRIYRYDPRMCMA